MTEKINSLPTVVVSEEPTLQTQYAGALAFRAAWHRFGVADILVNSNICYGKESDMASDMALALGLGPLVGATSIRQTAQRFGGEASKENLEKDELLCNMLDHFFSQRTLSRFVNQTRYDWYKQAPTNLAATTNSWLPIPLKRHTYLGRLSSS